MRLPSVRRCASAGIVVLVLILSPSSAAFTVPDSRPTTTCRRNGRTRPGGRDVVLEAKTLESSSSFFSSRDVEDEMENELANYWTTTTMQGMKEKRQNPTNNHRSSSSSIHFWGLRRQPTAITTTTTTITTTALHSSPTTAVMPDGGLSPCVIKVVGVGGGGSNAVDRMMDTRVGGVEFWAVNTDAQALGRSKARGAQVLNIGGSVTRGLGAGGNPEVGRMAAEESRGDIAAMVDGTDLCFVTSGMGGGTGSGAAPVVAEIAKESGALTVGIVTKPFLFEGARRMKQATDAIEQLRRHVDTVIVVSNNKLLEIIPENTPIERSFAVADDILRQGVVGISEIIIKPGLVNVDFADVRSVMHDAGTALMGIGTGVGKTRAEDAAAAAISSPLLDEPINQATGIVFNISGGQDMTLMEINRAAELIYASVAEDANVIFGALIDPTMGDEMSITVLATGFKVTRAQQQAAAAAASSGMVGRSIPTPAAAGGGGGGGGRGGRMSNTPARTAATTPSRGATGGGGGRADDQEDGMDGGGNSRRGGGGVPPQAPSKKDDGIPDFLRGLKKKKR